MKKLNITFVLAALLSAVYIIVELWNGFTRSLGSYYSPNETRHEAIVSSFIIAGVTSLVLLGLLLALRKKKLFADICWIGVAPALFMLSWAIVTKNLVENGHLAAGWLTDSAYLQEPGAGLHRNIWIIAGILIALPFFYSTYEHLMKRKH